MQIAVLFSQKAERYSSAERIAAHTAIQFVCEEAPNVYPVGITSLLLCIQSRKLSPKLLDRRLRVTELLGELLTAFFVGWRHRPLVELGAHGAIVG